MAFKTKVAGIEFDSYILNASGVQDTTLKELEIIGSSASSGIVMKSSTLKPRKGNPEPRCIETPLGIIQSMGWPNLGYQRYLKFASLLKERYDKPIVASVAGFCPKDYLKITSAFQKSQVDLIEINLSCPNIEGHPQIAYDFEKTEKLLRLFSKLGPKPIGLKLPAYLDFIQQERMAKIIKKNKISFITSINTIGNSLIIDFQKERPVIRPREGIGGVSGDYIKPMALGNVRGFYELFKGEISIFGVGGIKSGSDAFEFLLAGADAVQIGTTFEKEGPSCFRRINRELEKILKQKGYQSIQGVKGRLRNL